MILNEFYMIFNTFFIHKLCFFKKLDIWKRALQKASPRTRNFEPSKLTLDRHFPSSSWVNALLNRTCSIVSPYPEPLKRPSKLLLKNDASKKSLLKINAPKRIIFLFDLLLPLNAHISAPRAPPELIPELIVPEFSALSSQTNEYIYIYFNLEEFPPSRDVEVPWGAQGFPRVPGKVMTGGWTASGPIRGVCQGTLWMAICWNVTENHASR